MKLVLIDWIDSHSGRGWQAVEQLETTAEPLYCRSVGWLLKESNGCKVIVPHLAGEKQGCFQGCGDITIPNKAILKTTILRGK